MSAKQQTNHINYEPNRYQDTPKEDPNFKEAGTPINGLAGRQKIEKTNDFGQAGQVFTRYSAEEKAALVQNLAADLKPVSESTQLRVVCNFYRADSVLGEHLADRLKVDITPYLKHLV
jgi:catalase